MALPFVDSATLLLDLRANQLSLSDGDPVSTWADTSGNGYDFTQTGDARPIYHTGGGVPYVEFDGVDDILIGQNWAALDNPESLLIVTMAKYITVNPSALYGILISKQYATTGPFQYPGWDIGCYIAARGSGLGKEPPDFLFATNGSNFFDRMGDLIAYPDDYHITTYEAINRNTLEIYVDGDPVGSSDELDWKSGAVTTTSNTEPVRIGNNGSPDPLGWFSGYLKSILVYSPAPSAEDRGAIEAWLLAGGISDLSISVNPDASAYRIPGVRIYP